MKKTLFDLAGGEARLTELANAFYRRVLSDELLRRLFRDPDEDHAGRMAHWLIELTGGPPRHSDSRGGFSTMVRAHGGLRISEPQRARWAEHLRAACAELKLPEDFMAVFGPYLENSSHLAMRQSR
jgi:hemoglobin